MLRLRQPAWAAPGAVAAAERQLAADPVFTSVSGPLNANGTALTAAQYTALYAAYGPPRATQGLGRGPGPAGQAGRVPVLPGQRLLRERGRAHDLVRHLAGGGRRDHHRGGSRRCPPSGPRPPARPRRPAPRPSGVTGQAAFTYDVAQLSNGDLWTVIPIAIAVIAVLLALVMRSLIAPLYLIVSVVLSYFAALGLTVLLFVNVAGQPGLTFILPFLLFVFLLALGEDYNILVMTRIREEARQLPLREAVGRALSVTGTTVTSAGLVLAGTFGVLAIVGSGSAGAQNVRTIVNVGVGLALGVLMDTFLVRTLLVPSAVVLIGRWNWWPSALYRARPRRHPGRPGRTPAAPPEGGPAPPLQQSSYYLSWRPRGHGGRGGLAEPTRGHGGDHGEGDMPAARAVHRDPVGLRARRHGTGPAELHPSGFGHPDLAGLTGYAAHVPPPAAPHDPESLIPPGLAPRRPPGRVRRVEERGHRLGEVPQGLLLDRLGAGCQPRVPGPRLR